MEFDPDKLLADLSQHDSETDLDNLMNELSSFETSSPSVGRNTSAQQRNPAPSNDMDELDALMGQLGTNSPSTPQNRPSQQQSGGGMDELDALMGQLGSGSNTPSRNSPAPRRNPQPSQQQQRRPPQQARNQPPQQQSGGDLDELDALMGQLSSGSNTPSRNSPAPRKTPQPSQQQQKRPLQQARNQPPQQQSGGLDELDALMGQLGSGSNTPSRNSPAPRTQQQRGPPQQARNQPPQKQSGGMDELDALMGQLGSGSSTPSQNSPAPRTQQQRGTPQQARNPPPQQQQSGGMDELDALMGQLGSGPNTPSRNSPAPRTQQQRGTPQQARNPPPQQQQSGGMDELDALMGQLGSGSNTPSRNSPAPNQRAMGSQTQSSTAYGSGSSSELDDLLGSLGSSPAGSFGRSGSPAGSFNQGSGRGGSSSGSFNRTESSTGGRGFNQAPMGSPGMGGRGGGRGLNQSPMNSPGMGGRGGGRGLNQSPMGSPGMGGRGGGAGRGYSPRGPGQYPQGGGSIDDLLGSLGNQMSNINDGNTASRGICGFCQKHILGECIQAIGKKYHPDHFVCATCEEPLGTSSFYETDGQPNCEKCYNNLFCPSCGFCGKPISERCVSAMNKKWHVECFVCNSCCNPFQNGAFFEKNGMPYCQSCFQGTFATRCAGCNQITTGKIINALDQQWHPQCFACAYCRRPFNGGAFYEKDGKPYCEAHYHGQSGNVCDGCKGAITGRCVDALGKKFHPEHFLCNYCMNPLSGGGYTEQNGKPYCQACYANLF